MLKLDYLSVCESLNTLETGTVNGRISLLNYDAEISADEKYLSGLLKNRCCILLKSEISFSLRLFNKFVYKASYSKNSIVIGSTDYNDLFTVDLYCISLLIYLRSEALVERGAFLTLGQTDKDLELLRCFAFVYNRDVSLGVFLDLVFEST